MARYQNPSGKLHGFLLSGGVYTTLDDPFVGTIGTVARGINDTGEIVGYFGNASGDHGLLFNPTGGGTYTTLDDPFATLGTQAAGINDLGQILGSYGANGVSHGFLYSGGIFTTIDDPPF